MCCLSIKSQRFSYGAWHCLLDTIIPNVLHLSIDDRIEIENYKNECQQHSKHWSFKLIQECKQLEDLKVELNEDSDFDVECFENLETSILFIYLRDVSLSESTLDIERKSKKLEKATQHILKGKGRNLQFFRFGNRDKTHLYSPLANIGKMTKLRGLNPNVINCEKGFEDIPCPIEYRLIENLSLETLTDLEGEISYSDPNLANQFYNDLAKAKCRTTLTSRRLQDYLLNVRKFDLLVSIFKRLAKLQIINCVFDDKDMDQIIERMRGMRSLREIVIEYNEMFAIDLEEETDCRLLGFQQIQKLITCCTRLDNLTLKLNLSEQQKSCLRNINPSVDIVFE